MNRRRLVRVPASTANLGPGYDCLAAALSLHVEVEVEETGSFSVESDIAGIPLDRSNMCVAAFERLHPADDLSFRITSEVPLAAGLGSSGAAIVAGLVAADHMYELDANVLEHAIELEGHPDNVAAALCGGVVIVRDGAVQRMEPPPGLEGVIAIPPEQVATADARAALPAEVPLGDAVSNIASASLLVLGLAKDDFSLIGEGLRDRIHQDRRARLYPRSMELLGKWEDFGAVGATISGAGPTVLFWCHWQQTGGVFDAVRKAAPECDVRRVQFVPGGADVRAL